MPRQATETRIAPNIFRTPYGWRVYLWRSGKQRTFRFKRTVTLDEVIAFRDGYKKEAKAARRRGALFDDSDGAGGTFVADAKRYLDLPTVNAMPSYKDRVRDINRWVAIFANTPRRTIKARQIDEHLQAWIDAGASPSTVNKRRTALMSLFTRLDGRSGANPVRDSKVYEEREAEARGLPYPLVVRILNAVPATRSYSHLKITKVKPVKTRVRLEVMAWTGMRPSQLARLKPEHFSVEERWFVTPRSQKGRRRPRHPRPLIRKPLTKDAIAALERFVECDCWGKFSTSSVYKMFKRAVREVERAMRRERRDPTFRLPSIRPYDLRHSFGTEMFRRTKNLPLVQELLDHASMVTTKRYALGAVPEVLREAAAAFQAGTTGGTRRIDMRPRQPAAPRRRSK